MKLKYTITGLDCPNCAAKLATQMSAIDGVESAKINFLTEKLTELDGCSLDRNGLRAGNVHLYSGNAAVKKSSDCDLVRASLPDEVEARSRKADGLILHNFIGNIGLERTHSNKCLYRNNS